MGHHFFSEWWPFLLEPLYDTYKAMYLNRIDDLTHVIAITIRSAGYGKEWASNVNSELPAKRKASGKLPTKSKKA
ncbi:MAG: hypothetical protein IJS37_04950 [Bacilli bacterium]|nr:hypothetical protein [Bacilli bacterium]